MRFEGKVAIVTGSGQGIGEAYATALAAEGASVVVADLNTEQAERVAGEIGATGGIAVAVPVDVADPDSAAAMAAAATEAFGGIDCLVNNAAIYAGMKID
ncbi:MAG TPA: SDR family NAD(P)-dependent oxidoreductase, partial [Acidimicrobiales bacterium]